MQQLLLVVEVGGKHGPQDVLEQVGLDQRLRVDAVGVLRGDQDLLDLDRAPVLIAHRDLRLAVGAQVGQHLGLAHLREALGELVREGDRQRHELLGLVGRVAEHHALISRPGEVELVLVGGVVACLVCRVDALSDVGGLLVDRVDDRAGVAVEAVGGVVVADAAHGLARDFLDVDVGVGRDLAGDDDQAGVHERLARDAAVGIVAQHRVEHSVGDLVGDLVGVTLGHRLGGEQELVIGQVAHGLGATPNWSHPVGRAWRKSGKLQIRGVGVDRA